MNVSVKLPSLKIQTDKTFNSQAKPVSWETWHRRYGHVSYPGLQKILDGNMVDRFHVDHQMDKPDGVTCTEAKQHVESFPKTANRKTKPGELTHIDLWG